MVRSSAVLPFRVPPARWISWKNSPFFACAEPSNIMCSNRWAKPERPARSFRDPALYHRSTDTIGVEWSSEYTTRNPFGRVKAS